MEKRASSPGVLKIADFTNRKAIPVSNSVKSTESPKTDIQTKIATAKLYGNRELKESRKRIQELVDYLDSTALFQDASSMIKELLIDQMIDRTMEQALANKRPMGMSQQAFDEFRCNIFKMLIAHYVDNEKGK